MRVADFHYDLPDDLIAQYPAPARAGSRLLCLDAGVLADRMFGDIETLLEPGDVLVVNDTEVIKARLLGAKPSGGKVEVLIERVIGEQRALAQIRASKPVRPGTVVRLENGADARVVERAGDLFEIFLEGEASIMALMEACGHVPLPPYIHRPDEPLDLERYQTVYACRAGAVAAPTAGLHFDSALLERLRQSGIEMVAVTLHVGAATFQPIRVDEVRSHRMHAESVTVSADACARIESAKARGSRIVAVGTTSVRSLEAASLDGRLRPFKGETTLYIYPGFEFHCVDALITNFHLSRSTLLMLVCAFGGAEKVLEAYRHAVRDRYRFHSYGDAMFVTRSDSPSARSRGK